MAIGFPAIMANLATPVGSAYTIRVFSDIGEAAIAAGAVIDRVTPVAFGVIFALTGSIGPIIGQNYGARLMHRVSRTLTNSFILSIGYVLIAWGLLALAAPWLVSAFDAKGDSAAYVTFYCQYGVVAWLFLACLFVANTAFNNLGFPVLTMAFNWGRATLGTIPFVTFGARYGGVKGGLIGVALGCAVFGLIAVAAAYATTARLSKRLQAGPSRAPTAKDAEGESHDSQRHPARRAGRQGDRQSRRPVRSQLRPGSGGGPGDDPGLFSCVAESRFASRRPRRPSVRIGERRPRAFLRRTRTGLDRRAPRAPPRSKRCSGRPRRSGGSSITWPRPPGSAARRFEGMLPAVASILLGGLAHAMAGEGQSGVLADLANAAAAPGGLGSAIGSGGGFFGSIVGSIFGGSHEPADPQAAALAAGLASLSAMFVAGVQASQAQQASLGAIAQSFTQPPPTV